MAFEIGLDGDAFYGAAGGNPATALTGVRDVSISGTGVDAESTDRGSVFARSVATLREMSATFGLTHDLSATAEDALFVNILARTVTAFKFLDSAGKGVWGDCIITGYAVSQSLEDVQSVEVSVEFAAVPTFID